MADLKPKVTKKTDEHNPVLNGIAGLLILFVCVSIVYANYIVYFGTSDLVSKLMLIPSSFFVLAFLLYKAIK